MTDAPSTHSPGTPYGAPGQPRPTGGAPFFDWVRGLGFVRGRDRWLAGVCGAIAARTGLDPLIVRGIAIVVAILGGPILFLYAVAWALIPDESGRSLVEQAARQIFEPAMIAVGALLVLTFLPWMQGIWWQGPPEIWGMPGWLEVLLRTSWAIALTVGIILLVIYIIKRVPSPRTPSAGPQGGYTNTTYPTTAAYPSTAPADAAGVDSTASAQDDPYIPPVPPAPAASTADPAEPRSLWDDLTGRDLPPETGQSYGSAQPGTASSGSEPSGSAPYGSAPSGSAPYGSPATGYAPRSTAPIFDPKLYRELHRRKQLGAGFISVVAGLALTAGAVSAAVVADGAWSNSAFLVGASAALAVIAIGIVIAGIRGKEGGWLNGFSIVLAATVAGTAFIPAGTDVVTFGDPTWQYSISDPNGFAMIAGAPTIDLTDLDDAPSGTSRTIEIWVGAGQTELILPTDRTVRVEANALAGGIDYTGPDQGDELDRGGVFFHDSRVVTGAAGAGVTTVRVWTAFGQVTINNLSAQPALR